MAGLQATLVAEIYLSCECPHMGRLQSNVLAIAGLKLDETRKGSSKTLNHEVPFDNIEGAQRGKERSATVPR